MRPLTAKGAFTAAVALAFALVLLAPLQSKAQEVSAVRFEQQSDFKLGEDMLKFNVQTRKGQIYDEKTVNDDIKRLHNTGFFSDVVAETNRGADGKVEVLFKIKSKPIVKDIKYEGNKKFDTDKFKEFVTLTAEAPLNDEKLKESANALRKFYADKGYNDATVTPKIKDVGHGQVEITFAINENLRLKIDHVTFSGNTVYSEGDLKDVVATRYSMWNWVFEVGLLNRDELEKDIVRLREHYWERGYLDFKVKDTIVTPDPANAEHVDVKFIVEEGSPYNVGKVSLTGNKRFPDEELAPHLKMKPGSVYDKRVERADGEMLERKYWPLGYADYGCKAVLYPDYRTHTVDVQYEMVEGGVFTIKDIFISGNKITKDKVIRRELPITPGDPVDKGMIKVAKERLMGMGYFKTVDAVAISADEPDKKDVDIKVKEEDFMHLNVGGAASDTDGLAGTIDFTHTNFDILDPGNYFSGGGQRLKIGGLIGTQYQNAGAYFTEPWLFDIPLRFDTSVYWKNAIYQNWSEQRLGGTASLTKKFFDDFTSAQVGHTVEYVRIYKMDSGMSPIFQDETGGNWVSKFHLTLDRDTRDNVNDPTSGYNLNLWNAITSKILGASNNYYQIEGKASKYYSPEMFNKLITFSGAGKMGSMAMLGDNDKMVPMYERYFLGGGDSIRGFPWRQVGPVDNQGMVYGGQSMFLMTGEMTHPIYEIVRGAVFTDIGDVQSARFGAYNNINVGSGYGLRIKIPKMATPIRLDLAYPAYMQQENVRRTVRFHFSMGYSWSSGGI